MRFLADTSIVIRLYDLENPLQIVVRNSLDRLDDTGAELIIVPQIIVEFWAVATRPKTANGLGMSTENAEFEIRNLLDIFSLVPEVPAIFAEWRTLVGRYRVSGKPTHDTRIVAAMLVHGIDNILTLNPADFRRFTEISVVSPTDI